MKEAFEIVNKNNMTLRGFIYRPDAYVENENIKYPTVIFSHGFGSSCRFFFHHAEEIIKSNIVCVMFDFIGGGVECYSDGQMREMTLLTEKEDLEEVLNFTKNLDYVDTNKLFLWGESQGGVISTLVGANNIDSISGMILWYPAFVIPDDSKKRLETGNTDIFGIELNPSYDQVAANIDIYSEIEKYTNSVMIIHGDKDPVVPIEYSKRALQTFNDSSLIVIKDAEHGYNENQSDYARTCTIAFMKFIIG